MQYLKISNKGSLNRDFLEIIGLTPKRGSGNEVIGDKGSGTKLAAIAAMRLDLGIAVTSTDYKGQYLLRYDARQVDSNGTKYSRIYFDYSPSGAKDGKPFNERYPSGWAVDAFKDWDKTIGNDDKLSFKVLREFICNAYDEDKGFKLELVDEPALVPPGETAVYLLYTEEIASIFKTARRYFKFLSKVKPLVTVPAIGDIFPKSEKGNNRLFVQGVLVDCDGDWYTSVFDYSLREKSLVSEERIVKSHTDCLKQLALLLGQLTHKEMAKIILSNVESGEARFEEQALGQISGVTPASKKVWLSALHDLHGDKIAVASGNTNIDQDCFQIYGHKAVASTSVELKHFYVWLGVPKASDIVPNKDTLKYEVISFRDLEKDSRLRFLSAFERLARSYPERAELPIVLFHPLDEKARRRAGFAGDGENICKEIWVATETPTSLIENEEFLFETLLHEGRHCETKAGDYDRKFVDRADNDVSRVVYGRQTTEPSGLKPNFVEPGDPRIKKP